VLPRRGLKDLEEITEGVEFRDRMAWVELK
jgi:hypothetical protein